MGNYDRGRPQSRGGFNRRDDNRRGFSSGPREMHKAVCSKCGKDCEVPFAPTGSKPVFCNDCFKRDDNRRPAPRSFSGGRPAPMNNEKLEEINQKLDKILSLLNRTPLKTE